LNSPEGESNHWSTEPGPNEVTFYDGAQTGGGFTGKPSLSDRLQTPALDWSEWREDSDSTSIDYGAETVKFMALQTGSRRSDTFEGYVDGLELRHVDGRSFFFELEYRSKARLRTGRCRIASGGCSAYRAGSSRCFLATTGRTLA
jgi:hypothetical protein